jgi:hypothetical protein
MLKKKNKTTSNDPQNTTQKMEEHEPTEWYGRSMVLQKGKEFLIP